jgi:hypothetical protein
MDEFVSFCAYWEQIMTVQSNPVIFVVISVLAVVLIFGSYVSGVSAKMKPIDGYSCVVIGTSLAGVERVQCCQTFKDSVEGIEITYCTNCDNTKPPSNCLPRFTQSRGGVLPPPTGNNTVTKGGVLPPPTGNNTVTLPPGSIVKGPPISNSAGTQPGLSVTKALNSTSPIVFRSEGNATSPTNNTGNSTAMKVARAYSPTGYCTRNNPTTCLPCDPGLPGGKEMCIPTSQWPSLTAFPLAGNATSPGNNTGTITKVLPGIFKPTGNATNASPPPTLLAKHPSSGHHHHKGSTSSSSSNTNSTGH